jgi:hypothetical protein
MGRTATLSCSPSHYGKGPGVRSPILPHNSQKSGPPSRAGRGQGLGSSLLLISSNVAPASAGDSFCNGQQSQAKACTTITDQTPLHPPPSMCHSKRTKESLSALPLSLSGRGSKVRVQLQRYWRDSRFCDDRDHVKVPRFNHSHRSHYVPTPIPSHVRGGRVRVGDHSAAIPQMRRPSRKKPVPLPSREEVRG